MARKFEPIAFTLDTTEVEKLAALFPQMIDVITTEVKNAMTESGELLTTMVAARTPVNLGLLRSSIMFPRGFLAKGTPKGKYEGWIGAGDPKEEVSGMGGVSPRDYVNYVEFGTRPHWAPIAPLKLWALRKLGDENAAYAVQKAIAGREKGGTGPGGTKGAHMFKKAWDEGGKTKTEAIWKDVPARAVRRFERL